MRLDHTHDPAAVSWVASANCADADFPVQNLPFAAFRRPDAEAFSIGVGIGDCLLDMKAVADAGGLGAEAAGALAAVQGETLNGLMALGTAHWRALRRALFAALVEGSADAARLAGGLVPRAEVTFGLPAVIGDFTDFYASLHHALAIGSMLRPTAPLMPNYKFVPVAYHGRSSSILVSGHPVRRPVGQARTGDAAVPVMGASARLDYELELGFFVGPGNALGEAIPIGEAEQHVFGACLLNDWSARDIQAWEYQPLGPFLGKNFATTISPWVVTMEALAPFRVPATRDAGEPAPLPYLEQGADAARATIDVRLEVAVQTAAMRQAGTAAHPVGISNLRHAYWSFAQMVAHHTSNGCNLRAGDLLGTGTLSGPAADEAGSLMESGRNGTAPVRLAGGELRGFLQDGDAVVMRGWCTTAGARPIGFGECAGTILPALRGQSDR